MRGYDRVYAASASWPEEIRREHGVEAQSMLQATDPARFHPDAAEPDTGPDLLFVGNSKNEYRPIIADCRAAGLQPTVIPQPAGVASINWVLPNVPGAIGADLFAQALIVAWPLDAKLTNLTVDVVR